MANRISTEFSFSERGNGLKKIKADVKEADGLFGKMKAGVKGVTEELKTNRAAQAGMAAAAVAGAKVAIDAASGLEESVNAVAVVYGEAGDEVLALGENSAESFGLSQRAFNEFAVQFSAFANQIANESGRSVADIVEEMTTRVADFASVHNVSMEEAARIVQSTMAGETEAFRRYGGDVSAATIKTYAYENGIAAVGEELTEQQKVLARYGAFMEQTADRAGDFANTSDSLANQQRIMRANIEDSAASIGQDLLPVVAEAAQLANEAASSFRNFDDSLKGLTGGKGTIGTVLDIGTAPLRAMNSYNKALLGFVGIGGDAEKTTNAWVEATVDAVNAIDLSTVATEAQEEATEAARKEQHKAQGALQRLNEEYDDLGPAVEDTSRAMDDARSKAQRLREESERLHRANVDLVGGELAVNQAMRDAASASSGLDAELAELTQGTAEYDQAVESAAGEQLRAAEAAATYKIAQMEAAGQTVTAETKSRLMRSELGRLADELAPGSPLRVYLDQWIAQLMAIPTQRTTTIGVTHSGGGNVNTGTRGSGNAPVFGAEGAIVNRPTQALIGEAGPEAVIPLHKVPGNQSVDRLAGSMGGATINLTVNAGMGTDGAAVGRQITEVLESYFRNGGQIPPTLVSRLGG